MRSPWITHLVAGLVTLIVSGPASSQESGADLATADLGEIDRQLSNPLTSIWSMPLQNNLGIKEGDRVDGSTYTNVLFFQPAMPVPVGDDLIFIARPVFPLVTNPELDRVSGQVDGHVSGFGDMQLLALLGPSRVQGIVWGVGGTFKFPTASEAPLGNGRYQAGPALMAFHMGRPWVLGLLAQHWTSFAGDTDRADINRTDLQYIVRYSLPDAWSVGAGPSIVFDWEADSEDRLTLPVGLGVTKTVRWGSIPVKLRAEAHYSLVRPDSYGDVWNFRFQITPVVNNPLD